VNPLRFHLACAAFQALAASVFAEAAALGFHSSSKTWAGFALLLAILHLLRARALREVRP
jgi:hypothetical protein